jgi:hypothetical protein
MQVVPLLLALLLLSSVSYMMWISYTSFYQYSDPLVYKPAKQLVMVQGLALLGVLVLLFTAVKGSSAAPVTSINTNAGLAH